MRSARTSLMPALSALLALLLLVTSTATPALAATYAAPLRSIPTAYAPTPGAPASQAYASLDESRFTSKSMSGSGVFLQRDPSGYEDSVNLYAGFANDPVNLRDPTGRDIDGARAAGAAYALRGGREAVEWHADFCSRSDVCMMFDGDYQAGQNMGVGLLELRDAFRELHDNMTVSDDSSAQLATVGATVFVLVAGKALDALSNAKRRGVMRRRPGEARVRIEYRVEPDAGSNSPGAAKDASLSDGVGSPTAGKKGDAKTRQRILSRDQKPDGSWTCATCGMETKNPDNVHVGHIKPRSTGGDLSDGNLRCEGAACNLSQGDRTAPKPGQTCAERGSCGAPYGRTD